MKLERANEELIYFIDKYPKIISWDSLFETYLFSEEYILNNITKIFLSSYDDDRVNVFLANQILTNNILNEFIRNNICFFDKKYDFVFVSENPNLTIEFIEKYSNLISWIAFSRVPRSLDIIDRFKDYIDWFSYSEFASPEVFEKFKNKINITRYCYRNQFITKQIIIKYIEELSIENLLVNDSIDKEIKNYIRMFI